MSEQYQRFKQNFLKQHPSSNYQQSTQSYQTQKNQTSYKTYDPYQQITNPNKRNNMQQNLNIQNQSHYPFQQMQNQTFNDVNDDPFLSYKLSQKNNHNYQQLSTNNQQLSTNNQQSSPNNQQINNLNQSHRSNNQFFYSKQQNSDLNLNHYIVNNQYPDKFTSTKYQSKQKIIQTHKKQPSSNSRVQYKNYWQNDSNIQSQRSKHQSEMERINSQLQKVRDTSKISSNNRTINQQNQVRYNNQFSQNINSNQILHNNNYNHSIQNTLRPQAYNNQPAMNQYNNQNRRTNVPSLSPPKQLPIIYNTPNNLTNSGHKINALNYSPKNSRVIIQGNQHVINQMSPPIIHAPNHIPVSPPLPQKVSSNSRVIIQSQTINHPKIMPQNQFIPSSSNIIITGPPPNQQIQGNKHLVQVHEGGMISINDFQTVKNECIMWQQRYNQVNEQLIRLQNTSNMGNYNMNMYQQQQSIQLREQNYRLMQKIRSLQNNERINHDKIKQSYAQLLKKYQDSLTKECNLLVDRFKLQMKHNQRY